MLEDPIQMDTTITCGLFQPYFYENLFFPDKQQTTKLQKINKHCLGGTTQRTFYIRQRK